MIRLCALVTAVAITAVVAPTAPRSDLPRIQFHEKTPYDVRALAEATWSRFLDAFPSSISCTPDVSIVGESELADRASYRANPPTIRLRLPAPAGQLEAALIHEFAHHIEFNCPDHARLRSAFLLAQGRPATDPWFAGPSWKETPSEQYAEAVVEIVLGRRVLHRRLPIREEAKTVVREWGSGKGPKASSHHRFQRHHQPRALSALTRREAA